MEICRTESEYIMKIAPAAQRACKRYGYLPSILIGQSCLENGFGITSYWDNQEIKKLLEANNGVGIKSSLLNESWNDYTVWEGVSILKKTPEEYGGKMVTITDYFREYDSIERSFCDFLLFLTYASNYGRGGTPKYGKSVLSIKDPETLIRKVSALGYATGSTYPTSVMRIVNKHNLTKYDDLSNVKSTDIVPDILKGNNVSKSAKGKKVMIDAGHYGYYNQSPAVKEYWESKMTWKLHLMLKEELEKYGIIVGTTRKNQEQDMALYNRGYSSMGYDLFISVHSNAVGDGVNESVDYPVCFVQISGKSDRLGTLLSECVREVMQTRQPADHWSQRGNNGDYYGVLRGATAAGTVGVIVEHSFHTQTRATKWLLQDSNLRKLAVAEAKVIAEYLAGGSVSPSTPSTTPTTTPTTPTTKNYLSKGDSGEAVKTLQTMLNACGYNCGAVDGIFGEKTEAALVAFRLANKMTSTPKCTAKVKSKLEEMYKSLSSKVEDKTTAKVGTVYQGVDYSPVYNYTYYKKKYIDLRSAFGNDKQKYFDHFCTFGMKEGRQASSAFSVQKYKKRYEDLRKAFGETLPEYYKHYCIYGKKEGRKAV